MGMQGDQGGVERSALRVPVAALPPPGFLRNPLKEDAMAFFPCDVGPHPNPRRNINTYLGLVGDGPDCRKSGRLCEGHWGEIEPHLAEYEVMSDGLTAPISYDSFVCPSCREPVREGGIKAFLTAYPTKNDRKDYWLQFHADCDKPQWLSLLTRSLR